MPGTIVSSKELARTFEAELGGRPVARRRFAVNLSDNTLTNGGPPTPTAMTQHCLGAADANFFGLAHPDSNLYRLRKISASERFEDDPYKAEVVLEYGILDPDTYLTPSQRPAQWSFEARPGEVAALWYYHGSGQNDRRALTNSAYDYFPGLTREEQTVNIKIKRNLFRLRPQSGVDVTPNVLGWVSKQGFINSTVYDSLGAGIHTLKVVGVDAVYTTEEWNGQQLSYYETTATLQFRESTHNLLLPDVGWNYLSGGQKRRAMVFDFENNEWVASANPIGLDGFGNQTLNAPYVLTRRVNPETDLEAVFGEAPVDT